MSSLGAVTSKNLVPNFVKAASPGLLREAMFENNLRLQSEIIYQDIQKADDGFWYAWFYEKFDGFSLISKARSKK